MLGIQNQIKPLLNQQSNGNGWRIYCIEMLRHIRISAEQGIFNAVYHN